MRRAPILCALVFAACSSKSSGTGTCSGNDNCEAGEVCISGECVALCQSDADCGPNDCASGKICVDQVCVSGCRDAVPHILTIDGNGTEDGGTDARGQKTAHFLQTGVTILGDHLEGASATLVSQASQTFALTVVASTDQSLITTVPDTLSEGLYSLRVTNAVGEDQVDVWVLQGERGPAGEPQTASGVLTLLQSLGDPVPGLNAATAGSAATATSAAALTDAGGAAHAYEDVATPPGAVMYFATPSCPNGWIKANGTIAARNSYPDLYAAIGDTFGAGDGSTTFGLPDLRGEFLRAWDDGRGVDSGRGRASSQGQDFKSFQARNYNGPIYSPNYTHGPITVPKSGWSTDNLFGGEWAAPCGALQFAWDGSEVRPRNVALLACIKI